MTSAVRISRAAQRLPAVTQDVAWGLVAHGYTALSRLREVHGGEHWFGARMLGRRALVIRGEEGTRTFYDRALVTRKRAIPAPVRLLLFGPGAVHGLEGEEHLRRKALFLDLVDGESVDRLAEEVTRELEAAIARWPIGGSVRLFDELVNVYGQAVLTWAGTGTHGREAERISGELARIVDGFGIAGTTYPRAALARVRAQRWAHGLITDVRRGARQPAPATALARMADSELPAMVAATELLNVLRPTVAVAYFGAFAAHALDTHPQWRERLRSGAERDLRAFEHEVRRWYPFTPLLTGRLRTDYSTDGEVFRRGSWIVFDVPGTNRDPRSWDEPDTFHPDRFLDREPNPWEYVPHGGGDPAAGHRCPGEPFAVGILEATIRQLATVDFDVASGSRTIPMRRIPSLPPQHMQLLNVRRGGTAPTVNGV